MRKHLGIVLLAASFAPWAVYAVLPFASLPRGEAALLAGVTFVAGQIAFAGGVILVGRSLRDRLKACHACHRGRI